MARRTIEEYSKVIRELHPEPKPYTDESLFPFGEHKGKMMVDVPDKYLRWVYDRAKPDTLLKEYIVTRLCIPSMLNGTNDMTKEELLKAKM